MPQSVSTASDALVLRTIALCAAAALCEGMDLQAAGMAASGIGAEFHPSPSEFGTFFSASTFGLLLGALAGGRIADLAGRKIVLIASVALFGLFSLLTPLAQTVQLLSLARLLTGLGLGGTLPMLLALVTETSSAKRQSLSVACVYAAVPLGGAIISYLSRYIVPVEWRWIFIIGGVLPLMLAPIMAFGIHESIEFLHVGAAPADAAPSRRVSFWQSVAGLFAAGRAAETVFLWLSFLFALLLLYLLLNWLPTLLMSGGFSASAAATSQIAFNIGGVIATLFIGASMATTKRHLAVAIPFLALPLLLFALASTSGGFALTVCIVFFLGGATIAQQAYLYAMAPIAYPTAIRGIGVGAAVAIGRVGSVIGPKLAGALKTAGNGPSRLLMDLIPIAVLTAICALTFAWLNRSKAHGGETMRPSTGNLS
jgi:MFS transporter, AAHS family, 3-hydroxyphenylpropionic acid transporter